MNITLLEMIVERENEIGRIDTWERVLKAEGKELSRGMEYLRWVARRQMETLELVRKHQTEFVAMVQARRERDARVLRSSTARTSEPSSSERPPGPDATEPSRAPTPR